MNAELSRDIDKFIAENEEEIFRNIARLVAINSVETEAKPGAPFGEGPAAALKEALAMARELGATVYMPPLNLCGDNAAMIGAQGYYEYLAGNTAGMELNAYATKSILGEAL